MPRDPQPPPPSTKPSDPLLDRARALVLDLALDAAAATLNGGEPTGPRCVLGARIALLRGRVLEAEAACAAIARREDVSAIARGEGRFVGVLALGCRTGELEGLVVELRRAVDEGLPPALTRHVLRVYTTVASAATARVPAVEMLFGIAELDAPYAASAPGDAPLVRYNLACLEALADLRTQTTPAGLAAVLTLRDRGLEAGFLLASTALEVSVARALERSGAVRDAHSLIESALPRAERLGLGWVVVALEAVRRRRRSGTVQAVSPVAHARSVVLDLASQELRHPGGEISFARRPVLRELLRALAARPGAVVSRDDIVRAWWGARYDPRRHDNALYVNVSRLRILLERAGLGVRSDDGGYVLETRGLDVSIADAPSEAARVR
jgi:hypothetical protein